VKRACMPREEMSMQGMHQEEVVLVVVVVEVDVVDVGGE
jgi:hypothetical protein